MKKIFAVFILSLWAGSAAASDEEALSIIRKMDKTQRSKTSKVKMSMIVYPDASSEKNSREFRILSYARGEDDSYMEFTYPKTIQGLRILSRKDDIWAYFASTGRVRKIAGKSKDKSISGVGGDFSYEDMGGGKVEEKYDVRIISPDAKAWVIEGKPKKKDISYSKILFSVDKENYLPLKVEFYKKDKLEKTLTSTDIKDIAGRKTPMKMEMYNHQKDTRTIIITHDIVYDEEVNEKYFNPARFYK